MQVVQTFLSQEDSAHKSATLLTDLVNEGVRLFVYAGNADIQSVPLYALICDMVGLRPDDVFQDLTTRRISDIPLSLNATVTAQIMFSG